MTYNDIYELLRKSGYLTSDQVDELAKDLEALFVAHKDD